MSAAMQARVDSISIRQEEDAELGTFVYAVAVLHFQAPDGGPILLQELRSGGVSGVEGDLAEVGAAERELLIQQLAALGLRDPEAGAEDAPDPLAEIAAGVPRLDEWDSAADFMERVAAILDKHGITRPDHYPEED
jgi:hypothetical protein